MSIRSLFKPAAFLLSLALIIPFTSCNSDKPKADSKKSQMKGTDIEGGPFEASAVVAVPGTDGVLFIDDSRPGEVLWMQIDPAGKQAGQVKPIQTGASVEDPEGMAFDGTYFYIVGSQSGRKSGRQVGMLRFAFDSRSQSVSRVETVTGLRDYLVQNVPELAADGDKKGEDGGLNIEGLAWDPEGKRLLLGLRSPLAGENAMIVAVKMRDPAGPFSLDNLQLAEPHAIQLSLGGAGIRDIQYDTRLRSFLIISGAPEHHEKVGFNLWQWGGAQAAPVMKMELGQKMKPEGITRIQNGEADFLFLVGDASSYLKIDYSQLQ